MKTVLRKEIVLLTAALTIIGCSSAPFIPSSGRALGNLMDGVSADPRDEAFLLARLAQQKVYRSEWVGQGLKGRLLDINTDATDRRRLAEGVCEAGIEYSAFGCWIVATYYAGDDEMSYLDLVSYREGYSNTFAPPGDFLSDQDYSSVVNRRTYDPSLPGVAEIVDPERARAFARRAQDGKVSACSSLKRMRSIDRSDWSDVQELYFRRGTENWRINFCDAYQTDLADVLTDRMLQKIRHPQEIARDSAEITRMRTRLVRRMIADNRALAHENSIHDAQQADLVRSAASGALQDFARRMEAPASMASAAQREIDSARRRVATSPRANSTDAQGSHERALSQGVRATRESLDETKGDADLAREDSTSSAAPSEVESGTYLDHRGVKYLPGKPLVFSYQNQHEFWFACGPTQCTLAGRQEESEALDLVSQDDHGPFEPTGSNGRCQIYIGAGRLYSYNRSPKDVIDLMVERCR